MPTIRPVILSGGSGTRLWPLSTPSRPKQFVEILDGGSLFEATLRRVSSLEGAAAPLVVAGDGHVDHLESASGRTGIPLGRVLIEPEGRNTAPAIAAAAFVSDPDDVLLILPSDHLIDDEEGFRRGAEAAAILASQGHIVTFGVVPTRPDTGYGYIEVGDESVGPARRLARFKEKPGREEAESLVADGRHLWNSGMFAVTAATAISEMERFHPDVLDPVRQSIGGGDGQVVWLGDSFGDAAKISFDHAVMETTELAVVLPLDVGWSDIGSFLAIYENSDKDDRGNSVTGDVQIHEVTGSLVRATSRRVAVAGLSDIAVIETAEAVLVVPLGTSQDVRSLSQPESGS